MIVVTTRMRHLPEACKLCGFYTASTKVVYERPTCRAIPGYGTDGKPINPYREKLINPTNERPKWCPLAEVGK